MLFFKPALPSDVFLLTFLCSLHWVTCSRCLLFHFTCFYWVKWGRERNEDKTSSFTFHEHCFRSWQGVLLSFCRAFKLLLTLSSKEKGCAKTVTDNNKGEKKNPKECIAINECSVCSLSEEIVCFSGADWNIWTVSPKIWSV